MPHRDLFPYGQNTVPGQIPSALNLPTLEPRTPAPAVAPVEVDRPAFTVEGVTRGLLLEDAIERQIWAEVAASLTNPPATFRMRLNQLMKYAGVHGEQRRLVCSRAAFYQEHKGGDQNTWEAKRRQVIGLRPATPNQEFGEAQGPLSTTTGNNPNNTESVMALAEWMNKAEDYATDTGVVTNTMIRADGPGLVEDKDAICPANGQATEMGGLVHLDDTNREGYAGDEHMTHMHAQHQLKQAEMTFKACTEDDDMDNMEKTEGSDKPNEQKDVDATQEGAPVKDSTTGDGEAVEAKSEEGEGEQEENEAPMEKGGLQEWMAKAIPGAKDEGQGTAKSEKLAGSRQTMPSGVEVSRVEDGGKVAGKGTTSGANGGKASSLSSTAGCNVGNTGATTPLTADDPKAAGALKSNPGLVEQSGKPEAKCVSDMEAKGNTPGKPEVPMAPVKVASNPQVGSPGLHENAMFKSTHRIMEEQVARTQASTRGRAVDGTKDSVPRISMGVPDDMQKSQAAVETDPSLQHLQAVDEMNKGGAATFYSQQVAVVSGCRHCGAEMHKAITECDACGSSRFDLQKATPRTGGLLVTKRGLVPVNPFGADTKCDDGLAI